MFYKSKTCHYQTHLFKIVLIIAVVENGVGTNAIFLSNILLLMNYEGSAEKFITNFFFFFQFSFWYRRLPLTLR